MMIRAKQLHEVLSGRLGDGIRAAMLFNHDGALLGAASLPPTDTDTDTDTHTHPTLPTKEATLEAQITAAITSHIWSTYGGIGPLLDIHTHTHPLHTLIFELENARCVCVCVGVHHLLCLVGTGTAEVGLLVTKAQALGKYLKDALRQVNVL